MTHATPGRPQAGYARFLQTIDLRRTRGRHAGTRQRPVLKPALAAVAMSFVAGIAISTSVPAPALTATGDAKSVYALGDVTKAPELQQMAVPADALIPSTPAEEYQVAAPEPEPAAAPAAAEPAAPVQLIVAPVDMSRISGGFGPREAPCAGCSTYHDGVDFTPGEGTPIVSVTDGVVVTAVPYDDGGLGVHVEVQHEVDGQIVTTTYGHMLEGTMGVEVGQTVTAGQQLGLVGSTGQSTGPHMHFEIYYEDGVRFDGLAWLQEHINA
ncbi:M23 family metallopeptidase [Agromyces archimandritae]|uniref:M23 family metallopeptidase n=1 Tax=Agromyces archimandritae TaxID=2781962 RepID=A0A975IN56_9MICO|nr:M23 family metallopeptidase [Agromyces archimandritae]QTX04253.1 M23 family metallopeptidase [Agromyces archimandritae]